MSNDPRTRKGAKSAGTDRKTYCPHVLTALASLPKYRMTPLVPAPAFRKKSPQRTRYFEGKILEGRS